jgi:hypothetical protein
MRRRVERWGVEMPRRHLARSQAHPTHVLIERFCVGGRLRNARTGHTVTPHEAMVVAALGMPSPSYMSPARMAVPAHRSPRMGELVVMVGWVSGQEEDHVIAVAKGHELQAPKLDHCGQWKWTLGVSHPEEWRESDAGTQRSPTWCANCRCSDPEGP